MNDKNDDFIKEMLNICRVFFSVVFAHLSCFIFQHK